MLLRRTKLITAAALQLPQNSPESAENAPDVAPAECKPSQEHIQVMAIGVAHGRGRVVGRRQGLVDDAGKEIEIARSRWRHRVWAIRVGFGLAGWPQRGARSGIVAGAD